VSYNFQERSQGYIAKSINHDWLRAMSVLGVCLVILAASYTQTFLEIVDVWSGTSYFRVCWLVPPAFLFLLWHDRQKFSQLKPKSCWIGVPFALMFSLLWIAGEWVNIAIVCQLALLGGLYSLVLSVVGRPVFKRLIPYLALLLFVIPVWTILLPALKSIAISLVRGYAFVAQLPLDVNGFSLTVGSKKYILINQCSGLQFIMLGLITGWVFGVLTYQKLYKIILVSLLGGGVAILANALRISGIITYNHLFNGETELEHYVFELPALIPSFALLFYLFYKLSPEEAVQLSESSQDQQHSYPRASIYWGVLAVIRLSAGPWFISSFQTREWPAVSGVYLPDQLTGWSKDPGVPEWHPFIQSGQYVDGAAIYSNNDKQIVIYQALPLNSETKISGDAVALFKKGNPYNKIEKLDLCDPNICLGRYVHASYLVSNSNQLGHIYYVYQVGDHLTSSVLEFRLLRGLSRVWYENQPQISLIAIISGSGKSLTPTELVQLFTDLSQP